MRGKSLSTIAKRNRLGIASGWWGWIASASISGEAPAGNPSSARLRANFPFSDNQLVRHHPNDVFESSANHREAEPDGDWLALLQKSHLKVVFLTLKPKRASRPFSAEKLMHAGRPPFRRVF